MKVRWRAVRLYEECWQTRPNIMPTQSSVSFGLWIPSIVSANADRPLFWRWRFVVVAMLDQGMSRTLALALAVLRSGGRPSTGRFEARARQSTKRVSMKPKMPKINTENQSRSLKDGKKERSDGPAKRRKRVEVLTMGAPPRVECLGGLALRRSHLIDSCARFWGANDDSDKPETVSRRRSLDAVVDPGDHKFIQYYRYYWGRTYSRIQCARRES